MHLNEADNNKKANRNSKNFDIYEENNKINNEDLYDRRRSKHESELLHLNGIGEEDHEIQQQPHDFKVGEKVTCLKTTITERPVPHKVSIEYRPKDFSSSLPPDVRIPDSNGTDVSTLPSEDELSNGSGNVSPR